MDSEIEESLSDYIDGAIKRGRFPKQSALAVEAGLKQNTISNYFTGSRKRVDPDDLKKIGTAVAMRISENEDRVATEDDINLEVDRILHAAGYRTTGKKLKIQPVNNSLESIPLPEQLNRMVTEFASQHGYHADMASLRRIYRHIKVEMEEDARSRGVDIQLPDEFTFG
jgi:transcriptional regulator with XRE-family HTH domain